MRLRQEVKLSLRAVHKPLSEKAARADRYARLNDVVARALRIYRRVDEDEQPHALVGLQYHPSERQHCKPRRGHARERLDGRPRRNQHRGEHDGVDERASEVRLEHDERHYRASRRERRREPLDCVGRQRGAELRHHKRKNNLAELRRLEAEEAEVEPALSAFSSVPDYQQQREHREHRAEHRPREPHSVAVVELDDGEVSARAERAPDALTHDEAGDRVARSERRARAVYRGEAAAEKHERDENHRPVRVGADVGPARMKLLSHLRKCGRREGCRRYASFFLPLTGRCIFLSGMLASSATE